MDGWGGREGFIILTCISEVLTSAELVAMLDRIAL